MEPCLQMLEKKKFGSGNNKKFLNVLIDGYLNFDEYVLSQCRKASEQHSALICKFMTFAQSWNIMKVFIESQYCPLI